VQPVGSGSTPEISDAPTNGETLLEAQAILEKENQDIALVFQGGGPSWSLARARAEALGLKRIAWRTYASEARSLHLPAPGTVPHRDAEDEVQGMLWPSKLALMLALPRPILFHRTN
jgi:hypothetical protein